MRVRQVAAESAGRQRRGISSRQQTLYDEFGDELRYRAWRGRNERGLRKDRAVVRIARPNMLRRDIDHRVVAERRWKRQVVADDDVRDDTCLDQGDVHHAIPISPSASKVSVAPALAPPTRKSVASRRM